MGFYKVIKEYKNGGKELKWIPESEEEIKQDLRNQRNIQCFPIINRGSLWYDGLTQEQKSELEVWYKAWLDVTETKVIPEKPSWLEG